MEVTEKWLDETLYDILIDCIIPLYNHEIITKEEYERFEKAIEQKTNREE